MKPRHVAQYRLSRTIPGETCGDPRPLESHLRNRADREVLDGSAMTERSVTLWDRRPVPLAPFRIPRLGEPTPLLKRLVRHPISMEPGSPRRVDVFDASRPGPLPIGRESLGELMRFTRGARQRPAPAPHAPVVRSHPFHRSRAARLERDEEAQG